MKHILYRRGFQAKNTQIPSFMEIRPVAAELFHTYRQTDTTKLVVAFFLAILR